MSYYSNPTVQVTIKSPSFVQADKMKNMKLDHPHHISTRVGNAISDSGDISHATADDQLHSEASLSEQTINAMLRPQGFRGETTYINLSHKGSEVVLCAWIFHILKTC